MALFFMTEKNKEKLFFTFPVAILLAGIIIRLIFVWCFGTEVYKDYNIFQYTHDSPSHAQYIKFFANHLALPAIEKGLEYPQQPFYYIIAGSLYNLFDVFSTKQISSENKLLSLAWISAIFSIGALIFIYLTAKKITNLIWVQSFITGLMAFTPAFVYQSAMIGNDPLCTFLSTITFFFLIKYIQENKKRDFILSTIFAIFAFFTKASAGILLIMIFFVLIYNYIKKNDGSFLKMIYIILMVGFLCIGVTFFRAYIPAIGKFRFVESYTYEHQKTDPSKLSYFLTFNFSELLKEGQSFVFGNKKVARTLPTFLYGSFLFGEYSFTNITDTYPIFKLLMQFIILMGLLFPLGIIANLFFIKKWSVVEWISGVGICINLVLLIFFFSKYSAVCNSDFRYFCAIFLGFLVISGIGVLRLNEKLKIKFILPTLSMILIFSEFCWLLARIAIKIFANI
jgi:hypothetical protein